MNDKIQKHHRERDAYVYVRQSSMHQVRHHRESQKRQYALAERAQGLKFREVYVIDDDLGRSGSGSQERPGFARLVAAVCSGEVGAVFALEASRLARNNRDWHYLIDLCAMAESLVIDFDGVYDPRLLNDRLLLGLKGTMSEFELSLLRQRAQEALRQMVERGEVLGPVTIGYVRTSDNRMEKTPDVQVQDAIRGLFMKFDELGSVRQVLLWYRQNKLPFPTWDPGSGQQRVAWKAPVYNRIYSVLKNPAYAGAFVYGRRQTRTTIVDGRARRTQGHVVPRDQWQVVIKDHHAPYISWETFVRNQRQIESNIGKYHQSGSPGQGAAKSGPALLAGLLRCARCGRKLHVSYSGVGGRVPRYGCRGAHVNHGAGWCISFGGLRVDQAVSEQVLEAVSPLGIKAALEAWDRLQSEEDQKERALRLAIQKAEYEAERVHRQYEAVEPENRLVAAELERRWNEALKHVAELKSRLVGARQEHEELTEHERDRLLELGADLRQVWSHPDASPSLKKRILRTVLREIIVDIEDRPPTLQMQLHWAGGVHTVLKVRKNRTGHTGRRTDQRVVELVRELAKVCDDTSIAAILNRLGYRTGPGNTWTESRVRSTRSYRKIPPFDTEAPRTWVTMAQAARECGVSPTVIRQLIKGGTLPAQQVVPHAPWVIERDNLDRERVRATIEAVKAGRRGPRIDSDDAQVQLFQ